MARSGITTTPTTAATSRPSALRSLIVVFPYLALALLFLTRPFACRSAGSDAAGGGEARAREQAERLAVESHAATPWAAGMRNPLHNWLLANEGGPVGDRWHEVMDTFHQHLHRFQGKHVTVVELGVGSGASLAMWRHYFGTRAVIVGVDGRAHCRQLAAHLPNVTLVVGDPSDRAFLRRLADAVGPIDVLIDSGTGGGEQAGGGGAGAAPFVELYDALAPGGGVYVGEGLHASYWPAAGGGTAPRPPTFVEFLKGLVDHVNGFHAHYYGALFGRPFRHDVPSPHAGRFARSAGAVHFYDNVVVVEKRPRAPPALVVKGDLTL